MTQAFNLSQLANKVNTSGQADLTTAVTGTLPIANGGTNNASLAVTAGGVVYTDGSKQVNTGAGTSGQFLQSNGASAPTWASLSVSGTLKNIQYFTSGSSTYTPTSGTTFVIVEVIGGGAGGGVSSPYGRTDGGTSSFGALVSATGGTGASGGTGSNGDLNITGGAGISYYNGVGTSTNVSLQNGSAPVYGAASGGSNGSSPNTGIGAGGSAIVSVPGYATAVAGAGGGYARKKITSGFSGVTVTVGSGGSAGGVPGSNGNNGIVIVYEYA